ncbi:TlpA family protein disulfide reductase [Polaromonas sp. CT11-55]|uniref:TlpA family protein disulfide reductase n=1 Tax=Polaromonas sp. CT11-55 TaxID=3243045 RepID=UPI0039A61CE9
MTGPAYEVSPWGGPVSAFALVDTNGKTWSPADLRSRAVLLNFWASWCEPCRAEMPTLQQVADFYGPEKLLVLAINFKEPAARALQFAKTTGVTLPVLLDLKGEAARRWGVKVFPTTLMLDSAGRPRLRVKGEVDWTGPAAAKLIDGLLKP